MTSMWTTPPLSFIVITNLQMLLKVVSMNLIWWSQGISLKYRQRLVCGVFRHALSPRRALITFEARILWPPMSLPSKSIHSCYVIPYDVQYCSILYQFNIYIVITIRTTLITQICQLYFSDLPRTTCKESIYNASYSKCHLLFPTGYLNYEHIACVDMLCHLVLLVEV